VVGVGAFDNALRTFETQLATLTLAFDSATGTWRGDYTVPATGVLAGNISVRAFAHDGAGTPNEGKAVFQFSALEPEVEYHNETIYQNQTVYQNRTIEVAPPGSMDQTLGYGLAGVGIAIGAVVGMMVARGRKGGGGAASAPAAKAPEATAEKKKDEGWD
jgi:hypothetical protein